MSLFGPKIAEKLPYLAKKPHFRAIFLRFGLGWDGVGMGVDVVGRG